MEKNNVEVTNEVSVNCGNSFTMNQIGESAGGCNPWPILEEDKTETDSEIKISYEFLKESSVFRTIFQK